MAALRLQDEGTPRVSPKILCSVGVFGVAMVTSYARADGESMNPAEPADKALLCEDGAPKADASTAILRWARSGLGYEHLLLTRDRTVFVWEDMRGAKTRTCRRQLSQVDFDRAVAAVRKLQLCKVRGIPDDSAIVIHDIELNLGTGTICRVRTTDRHWRRQQKLVTAERLVTELRSSVCGGGCPGPPSTGPTHPASVPNVEFAP
jgi:hypothetical protein